MWGQGHFSKTSVAESVRSVVDTLVGSVVATYGTVFSPVVAVSVPHVWGEARFLACLRLGIAAYF